MAHKQYESSAFRKKRQSHSGLIIAAALIAAVLVGGSIIALAAANYAVEAGIESAGLSTTVAISGNDLYVTFQKSEHIARL